MSRFLPALLFCAAAAPAFCAMTEEEVSAAVLKELHCEAEILRTVHDADTAAAAIPPLNEVFKRMAALKGHVEDNALWNYIDSTEGLKPQFIEAIQDLARQFDRLEQARFWGCRALIWVLIPQLNADFARPATR